MDRALAESWAMLDGLSDDTSPDSAERPSPPTRPSDLASLGFNAT